jgi:hypothetical protein
VKIWDDRGHTLCELQARPVLMTRESKHKCQAQFNTQFDGVYEGTFEGVILGVPGQPTPAVKVSGDLKFSVFNGFVNLGDLGTIVSLDGSFTTPNDVTLEALVDAQFTGQFQQDVAGGGVTANGSWYIDTPTAPGVGNWRVDRVSGPSMV